MGQNIVAVVFLLGCFALGAHAVVDCNTTGAGRWADPADTTCQNYTLCVLNNATNTFLAYNYVCPNTAFFSPTLRQCTTNYVCPTNNVNTTTTGVCTADGFVADPNSTDCSSYVQCVNINGVFSETVLTCPANTFYNPTTTLCEGTYVCPVACTAAGRIANTADATCQSYFLCVVATNGTIAQYAYTCPTTSLFNPTTQVCTTNYTCA